MFLQLFTLITVLFLQQGTTASVEDDFPQEVVSEDLVLTRDNLEEYIKNTPILLTFFFDRQDSRMEKVTGNVRKAVAELRKSGIKIQFGTFEAPLTPRIEKTYHVYKMPKIIVFMEGNRYPMGAPPYPRQIIAFVKRLIRESEKTISYKLKDKSMFGTLIEREGTLVVYCGKNKKDPEFDVYEGVARDAK